MNLYSQTFSTSRILHDDGFVTTATEHWFKVKVQLIQQYFQSFATHVSAKATNIVFVDLYAGSGLYSLGSKKELFDGTCLASLQQEIPITKWIFCESSGDNAKALKVRVNKYFKEKNAVIFESKPEQIIDKFRYYVPPSKGSQKTAIFCVVDPFSLDISFDTLDKLTDLGFSFLIPYTFGLNGHHDFKYYQKDQREKLKKYLGGFRDIDKFDGVGSNHEFYKRLVKIHQNNMLMLGLNASLSVHKLDSRLMELPLYYMGFFSKQTAVKIIQREVQAEAHHQLPLF